MMKEKLCQDLNLHPSRICLVGSQLICGKGNDHDFLILDDHDVIYQRAIDQGFAEGQHEMHYEGNFTSIRRGLINLLITHDAAYYASEVAIAFAAQMVNNSMNFDMTRREDRVMFHGIIRERVADYLPKK